MQTSNSGDSREITADENRLLRQMNTKKYSNVEEFLANPGSGHLTPMFLGKNTQEITVTAIENTGRLLLEANPSSSIGYGLFVARGQFLGLTLGDNFETRIGDGSHSTHAKEKAAHFFGGELVEMPRTSSIASGADHDYRSFEEYSATKETEHLSPWVFEVVNRLMGSGYGSALELPISVDGSTRMRDARMDVVHFSDQSLLCLEAKISVESAVRDGRVREQAPGYRRSLKRRVADQQLNVITDVLIVPGGGERGLVRQTATADGRAFLKMCESTQVPFITANALWCLLMRNLLDLTGGGSLVAAIEELRRGEFLGLTSAGYLTDSGEVVAV